MKRKKIVGLLLGLIGVFALSSCSTQDSFFAENFSCRKIDETSIAIGDINSSYSSNIVFVPSEINDYTVRKLGYASGLGFGGTGYLTSYRSATETTTGYRLERFYCPNTINDVMLGYMKYANDLNVFYCGAVLNIIALNGDKTKFYVPNEKYETFCETIDEGYENWKKDLYRANVAYMLNYETENAYYYVDNYEYGGIIAYTPPEPKREGYTFSGWYREPEGMTEWLFTQNTLPELTGEEEYKETKLYAKWQKQ